MEVTSLRPGELVAVLDKAAGSRKLARNILTRDHNIKFVGFGPLPKGGLHHEASEKDINCSAYFRAVGCELEKLGYRLGSEWKRELLANGLADYVRGLVSQKISWTLVQEREVQDLADQGVVVVGLFRNHGKRAGHVAIAFPNLTGRTTHQDPPLVRDGNEHLRKGHLYAGSWGAIGRKEAFGGLPVEWYRYRLTR